MKPFLTATCVAAALLSGCQTVPVTQSIQEPAAVQPRVVTPRPACSCSSFGSKGIWTLRRLCLSQLSVLIAIV